MSWNLRPSQRAFTIQHAGYSVELTRWNGLLGYRVGYRDYREPIEFALGSAGAQGDKAIVTMESTCVSVRLAFDVHGQVRITGTLRNHSAEDLALDRLALTTEVRLGSGTGRHSFFKNGYQSWSETRSFCAQDRELVPLLHTMTVLQDNPRNLSSQKRGEFTSDMFAVLGNLEKKLFLLLGQAGGFRQFIYIKTTLAADESVASRLELQFDFVGQVLPAGGQVDLDAVVIIADDHANRIQDRYFDLIQIDGDSSRDLPTGWCSWYYYYAKVSERDVRENLDAIRARKVDWRHFVLDDGYETAVGDWLSTNDRFPDGLAPIAASIRAVGLTPGLWIAPFIARRNSRLYREHSEWLLRDDKGKPVLAGWNPTWGLEGRFYGLDTTHPGFQEQLREWIQAIVHTWGFRYLKLDFTYGACLYGLAYDRSLSAAERLALGYTIIREAAGEDVFILGCGSPLSPAVGLVDAMRVGPDVAPYWFAKYRYYLTRDPHALCTKFAIRNVLNRCQMHRRLWINDPDCLLLRDTDTKLTPDERMSLVNAVIISGGMYFISDRLTQLVPRTWKRMDKIERLVRECDQGRPWALDYMERGIPEIVYNSKGYLAVFNFVDRTIHKRVPLNAYLERRLDQRDWFVDVWNSDLFIVSDGILDLGQMRAHSSRLLKFQASAAMPI